MPTKIEWTNETWNPIRARNLATGGVGHFCVHASEGCRNCYAERLQPRFGNRIRYAAQDRGKVDLFLDDDVLAKPLRWRKPRMIFVCSMTDLFADFVPDEWIDRVFAVMALAPQHMFQVLTKRAERMLGYMMTPSRHDLIAAAWNYSPNARQLGDNRTAGLWPFPNIWLGTSIEDRPRGLTRAFLLSRTPAAVRYWSVEPLLEDLGDLTQLCLFDTIDGKQRAVDWVIVGGESGPRARDMDPAWARSIRDQCRTAGVAFFMKQMARRAPIPDDLMVREWPA